MKRWSPSRREFLGTALAVGSAIACPRLLTAQERSLQPSTGEQSANRRLAKSQRGVVATVHPLASRAAIEAFERGGNAIDAAVAASLMLSVVDGHNSGLGGGCLALVRAADGSVHAIDGRETAPASATPEMFYRDGRPDPRLSQIGPLAAGVPGLPAALHHLSERYGQSDWTTALQSAASVAEAGFTVTADYARVLQSVAGSLKQFPSSAQVLLDADGNPWTAGATLRQADLARTLQNLANHGVDWFYEGEFAERTQAFMEQVGGRLTQNDFAAYQARERAPVQTTYREHAVVGFPPPSSGGIHIAQMLGMLSEYDLRAIFDQSAADGLHLLLEVMKRAMADRAYWLGDADIARVPRGLLDPDYLRERASSIDLTRTTPVASHGQPPRADVDLFGGQKHTTHLTTADETGNVVAITQTVNTSFGSKMIVPGTGVVLNNEMDDFSIAPGVRNAFGLLGSEANVIAPGKRPLSSMSPTIVLDDQRQPVLSCGAAGGPKIITTVLQVLVRVLDLRQSIDEAIAAPRVHHQWSPDQAICESDWPQETLEALSRMGHTVETIQRAAVCQGLMHEPDSGQWFAAADPRVPSAALGL